MRFLQLRRGKWWLILGLCTFVLMAVYNIADTYITDSSKLSIGTNAYMAVDWFAACIIYFFFGALVGYLLDWRLHARNRERTVQPLWLWLTIGLWVLSVVLCFTIVTLPVFSRVFETSTGGALAMILFFPIAFGVFFHGIAFLQLFPGLITKYLYTKLVLDVVLLGVFGTWLWLQAREQSSRKRIIVRRVLLLLVFFILIFGLLGCVKQIAKLPAPTG
jgi:hypothetical protein